MFGLIEKAFFAGLTILSSVNLWTVTPQRCISITNQECKIRPERVNVNSDDPVFYPFSIKTSKSVVAVKMSMIHIQNCVPDVAKNISLKVLNLMSRTNETRHIKWRETCKCKCRLDASVFSSKQRWNYDRCRCECRELIDKDVCDKGSIWNPSNCECECDESCYIGEYLDYENCKYMKKLVDKLAEECHENVEEAKTAEKKLNECNSIENIHECSSCTLYIVLFSIIFTVSIGIATYFVYYKYVNHNNKPALRYNYVYQANKLLL